MNKQEQLAEQIAEKYYKQLTYIPLLTWEDFKEFNKPFYEVWIAAIVEGVQEEKYKIDPEFEKITGWPTPAEWFAWQKGQEDFDAIVIKQIEKWDGVAVNSGLYDALKKKVEAVGVQQEESCEYNSIEQVVEDALLGLGSAKTIIDDTDAMSIDVSDNDAKIDCYQNLIHAILSVGKLQLELQNQNKTSAAPVQTEAEAEREAMIQVFSKVRKLFELRKWIMEGRGSYPYDDDRYKEEVRYLYDEFDALDKDLWKNIKSKTFEYRDRIIEEYKAEQAVEAMPDEQIAKAAWDLALTMGNNLCVQISDKYNNDDLITEADTANECAKKVREWIGQYPPELFSQSVEAED